MEVKRTIKPYVLVRLLRMNDEINLSNGERLWLDVDFDHVPHVPVVGEVVSEGRGRVKVGDIVVMDRSAAEIALKQEGMPRIFEDVDGRKVAKVFVRDEDIIAVKRDGQVFTINSYVITEAIEEELSSAIMYKKKSTKKAKVVLAPEDSGLNEGDVVIFRAFADVPLEHQIHKAFFDKVVCRMKMDAIFAKEEVC